MVLKVVLVTVVIAVFAQNSEALKCYMCRSQLPNRACFTPIDTNVISAFECNTTSTNIARVINGPIDGRLVRAAETATEYECLTFQKHFKNDNITEMGRDCFPKQVEVDSCTILKIAGGTTYNLTQCNICTTDYCNSSYVLRVSGLLLLCLCLLRTALQ